METLCRAPGQDCRLISHCPAVLKLVFKKVKAGDPGARQELLQSQCGFEKSLPKVCCGGAGGATDRPRIFQNSNTVPASLTTSTNTDPTPFTTSTTTTTTTTTPTTITVTTITTTTTTTTATTTTISSRNFSSLNWPSCGTRTALTFRITLGKDASAGQFP